MGKPDEGLLNGARKPYFGAGFLVPLGLILVACGAIFYFGHQVAASLERGAHEAAEAQGSATAREIAAFLRREHERLEAFVQEKQFAIARIVAQPDDWDRIETLQASVKRFFPGAFAFTVTGSDGVPLFEDFDGLVGDACLTSLQAYATSLDRGEAPTPVPPIHPVPDAYHFDLITRLYIPVAPGGLFFVSIHPTGIAELIQAAEQASGMKMLLVKRSDPTLIEITANGGRDLLQREVRLDPATWEYLHFSTDIPGTHWRLVAMPNLGELGAAVDAVYRKVVLLIAALLLISGALLWMIRRAERRDNRLFMRSLQASLGRQRAILQSMADTLVAIDDRGRVVDANNAVTRVFGYEPRDIIGHDLTLLLPDAGSVRGPEGALAAIGRDSRGMRGGAVEVLGRRRSGERFPVLLTLGESEEADQPIYVCILHDLSDVRAAQRKIDAQARTIRRSFHELDAITPTASNDVEQPLRRMAALGDSLGDAQRGTLARYASIQFDHFANRAVDNDPIEHPRDESGGEVSDAVAVNEAVDLNGILRGVARDLADKLDAAGGEFIQAASLPVVAGDPRALRQVFWNLVDNAIKFRALDRPLRVEVDCTGPLAGGPGDTGRCVAVIVQDNGIGFDPGDTATVFEPFVRLHPRGRYPGNGLGLFFCRKIVENLGGSVSVVSVPGQGCRFRILLPATQVPDEANG